MICCGKAFYFYLLMIKKEAYANPSISPLTMSITSL